LDKNTVTGLLLIFVLTIAWAWFTMPSQEEIERQEQEQLRQDSIAAAQVEEESTEEQAPDVEQEDIESPEEITTQDRPQAMGVFAESAFEDTLKTTIQTPLYEIQLTNLGAGPSKYTLLGHKTWDQQLVQMIADTTKSAYSLEFLSSQNYNIETNQLLFEPLFDETEIALSSEDSTTVSYRLNVEEDSYIQFNYTFYADQYAYNLQVELNNMQSYISGTNVELGWKSPLNVTERDRVLDAQGTMAYTYAGEVLEDFKLEEAGQDEERINGTIDWVSTRTRFFGQYIKPVADANASTMIGEVDGPIEESGTLHHYQVFVQSGFTNNPVLDYEMYVGPLRYYDLRDYDEHAYDVIEIGYALFRWFADPLVRYAIIPFFAFGSMFISNYGILIILFGVIIKLALFPLTQKSFKSMAAMRELQPQLKEIQEKHKDDPQKQQKETIALYKKAKVNPLGGCLPMLLQFPILITLFFFFQNSMIIRQESFLWASDLSAPDYILDLPFTIPLLGDQLAGFVLLMSAAMFLQTKVTGGMSSGAAPSGGPNMKVFMYIMPVMLLFIFNNFAAGLSLYYLVYNVLSIAQQFVINKQTKSGGTAETEVTPNNAKKKGKKKK